MIIRDWRGKAIGAFSMSVPATQSVVELEALACRIANKYELWGIFDSFPGLFT